jgi:hypothetical protein
MLEHLIHAFSLEIRKLFLLQMDTAPKCGLPKAR